MAEVEKKPIKITETILRDAHQSLIATRMPTEVMLPILDKLDKIKHRRVFDHVLLDSKSMDAPESLQF